MKRTTAWLLLALVALPLPAFAAGQPSPAVSSSEPYASGQFFATTKCLTQKFSCRNPGSKDQIISMANSCAGETFSLAGTMATLGTAKNGYPGCVLPNNYREDPTAPMKKQWAVCCVAPAKFGDMCTFDCSLFYNNN